MKHKKIAIAIISIFVVVSCSKDKSIDIKGELMNSSWYRDSHKFSDITDFDEFGLKDKYTFHSNGTFSCNSPIICYFTKIFPIYDSYKSWGTWQFDEKTNEIDFEYLGNNYSIRLDSIRSLRQFPDTIESVSYNFLPSHFKIIEFGSGYFIGTQRDNQFPKELFKKN